MIPTPVLILRECLKCGWQGPLTGFVKNKRQKLGYTRLCRVCHSRECRERYEKKHPGTPVKYHFSKRGLPLSERASNIQLAPTERECYICGETKSAEMFIATPQMLYGRSNLCMECHLAECARRYAKNPEPAKIRTRKWDQDNPEKAKKRAETWKGENRERWREIRNSSQIRRSAIKQGITQEPFSLRDECEYCGAIGEMSADHMIPISFKAKFDIDGDIIGKADNIVSACRGCNSKKNKRLPDGAVFLQRVESLLGYDPKEKFDEKHFWEVPVLQ